jgi:hypothetical protein
MEKTSHKYDKQKNNEDNLKRDLDKPMQMEKFQVLSVVNIKIAVFVGVAPHSLVGRYQHFSTFCCLCLQGIISTMKMEAIISSKMWLPIYKTTQHHRL